MNTNQKGFEIEYDMRMIEPNYHHAGNQVMDVFNFFFDDFVEYLGDDSQESLKELIMEPLKVHAAFLDRVIPHFAIKVLPQLCIDASVIVATLGMDILEKKQKQEEVSHHSSIIEYPPTHSGGQPIVFVFRMFVKK